MFHAQSSLLDFSPLPLPRGTLPTLSIAREHTMAIHTLEDSPVDRRNKVFSHDQECLASALPLCPIILGRHRQSHHLSSRAPLASFRQRTDSLLLATLFGCVGSGSCQETQCSCLCAKITPILFLNLARREKRSDCATFWKFGSKRPLLRRNTHVFSHKSNCSITSGARQGNPTV